MTIKLHCYNIKEITMLRFSIKGEEKVTTIQSQQRPASEIYSIKFYF